MSAATVPTTRGTAVPTARGTAVPTARGTADPAAARHSAHHSCDSTGSTTR